MRRRTIAPRLASGVERERWWGRLPPAIKDGLRAIAREERQSMSWVVEQTIIRYFKLKLPTYRLQKTTPTKLRRVS